MLLATLTVHILCFVLLLKRVKSTLVIQYPTGVGSSSYPDMTFEDEEMVETASCSITYRATYKETEGGKETQFWIKISKDEPSDQILENEWVIYTRLEAVAELGSTTPSEAANAGIHEVYFLGLMKSEDPKLNTRLALVMKPLGINLFNYCKNVEVAEVEWLRINFQMMTAVHFVHSKGVIHGNIKPDNFMFDEQDSVDEKGLRFKKVYLLGFGHSQLQNTVLSSTNHYITVLFMSINIHKIIDPLIQLYGKKEIAASLYMSGDIEACAFSMYYIRFKSLVWEQDSELFYALGNLTETEAENGAGDKKTQITKILREIMEKKYTFKQIIEEKFGLRNKKGARDITAANKFSGMVLINMVNFARFQPDSMQNVPVVSEKTLVEQWKFVYLKLLEDTHRGGQRKQTALLSSKEYFDGVVPTNNANSTTVTAKLPLVNGMNTTSGSPPIAEKSNEGNQVPPQNRQTRTQISDTAPISTQNSGSPPIHTENLEIPQTSNNPSTSSESGIQNEIAEEDTQVRSSPDAEATETSNAGLPSIVGNDIQNSNLQILPAVEPTETAAALNKTANNNAFITFIRNASYLLCTSRQTQF